MSIISLTMAPIMAGNDDWPANWYIGLVCIVLLVIGTYLVYYFFWKGVDTINFEGLAPTQRNASAESSKVSLKQMDVVAPEEAPIIISSIDEEAPSMDAN